MPTLPRLTVGDIAPDSVVLDTAGHSVSLSAMWQHGPLLLSMLRHFG